jgi:3-dehydroquinate dehydratase-2
MKILVINGPNLNLLGSREPDIYGKQDYAELLRKLDDFATTHSITIDAFQSNSEGALIDKIHAAAGVYDGIVINPGAYTHYSIAILDALKAIDVPAIEVHLSNIAAREDFRHTSVTAAGCIGQISGLGFDSYFLALVGLMSRVK